MARKPTGRPYGRTSKEILIDWAKVDQLLIAGCHGTEIAPHFDMHYETFYKHVENKYGMTFTEYSSKKKCHGDSLLRAKQYEKALKGDNVMMVWLGKNRLGQRDGEDKNKDAPHHEEIKNLLLELKNANQPKANPVVSGSDEASEHMGRCSPVREDLQLDSETY